MTDEKCRTCCRCYVQDGECDDKHGTIVFGPQFYEDCLLRLTYEQEHPRCPQCGEEEHLDVYSAPNCFEGPVILHCGQCGTKWNPASGEVDER